MSGEVNNPKEVQNISREMDSLRRQKEKLENGILEEMEKREKVAEHLTKVQTAIKVSEKKEAAAIRDFQTTGTEIQAEIDRLNATRVTVAREMEAGLLARYESLRDAKHGIGAGLLRDDGCSACRMELPSERVQALQESGSPIGECPMCHRLLVVRLAPDPEER
jgi:predicted  nucleic acid-binding Zn-ribbon protein